MSGMVPSPTTGRSGGYDTVTLLSVYLVLLLCLPSRLIFGPLGAAGTPAQIVAICVAVWWLWDRMNRSEPLVVRTHPIRKAMLLFVGAVLLSYLAATTRAVSTPELTSAELGLLALVGWLGIVLVCDEGISTRERLDALVRRLVLLGGLVGALGVAQFVTRRPLTDLIQIPGLSTNNSLDSILSRDSYVRPSGTALHPIEFGVTMSLLLPLALHVAMQRDQGGPVRRWFPVLAIAAAIPISISRSAILGTVVALALVIPTWTRTTRRLGYLVISALVGAMFVTIPGILGTLANLFTGISQDASALSRTDGYAIAEEFIARSPLVGRGFMTFLPEYRILDNQYLGLLIDAGVLGVLALLGLFVTVLVVALRRRRRSTDPATRSLAQALAAAMAASAVCFAFFDAFSFPLLSGLTFLVVGLVAALEATSPSAAVEGDAQPQRSRATADVSDLTTSPGATHHTA